MYDVVKKVIDRGRYDLADIIDKIDVLWVDGKLSDDERADLSNYARTKSKPYVNDADDAIVELALRVQELEERVMKLEGASIGEYPEFEQGRVYRYGDKITWTDGNKYVMVVVGETAASPGLYPDAWEKVE